MAETSVYDVFENDIEMAMAEFIENPKNMIETDLKHESQQVWNSCLMYIRKRVFSDNSILKSDISVSKDNSNVIMATNYNKYNIEMCMYVLDIYINICMMNDKEISKVGYSLLTGINYDTINSWEREEGLTSESSVIPKKLKFMQEESLANKLASGKSNPVAILGILNHRYGWNGVGAMKGETEQQKAELQTAKQGFLEYQSKKQLPSGV